MKKKNTLSVKPLRRYNTPIYPSYLDKNPIEHPDTLPYPFTYKALQALAAAGILVGASCSPTKEGSNNLLATPQQEVVQDSLTNPFAFENLRIPYRPAMFGTGMPARLSREDARTVIYQVFVEEGLNPKKNYHYKNDSISVVLDGFDPKSNIGYIWVDGYNMGGGIVAARNGDIKRRSAYEGRKRTVLGWYPGDANLKEFEEHMELAVKYADNDSLKIELGQQFNEAKLIDNPDEKIAAYRAILVEHRIKSTIQRKIGITMKAAEERTRLARDYFQKHLNENSTQADKARAYTNWMFRNSVEQYLQGEDVDETTKQQMRDMMDNILDLENEEEKIHKYDVMISFLSIYRAASMYKIYDTTKVMQVFKADDMNGVIENMQQLEIEIADQKLTLQEAQYLKNIHRTEQDYIAQIGARDRRFHYSQPSIFMNFTKEEEEKLQKIKSTGTAWEYQKARREFANNDEKRDPKAEALKALETQVRQYIQWAKQQGAY